EKLPSGFRPVSSNSRTDLWRAKRQGVESSRSGTSAMQSPSSKPRASTCRAILRVRTRPSPGPFGEPVMSRLSLLLVWSMASVAFVRDGKAEDALRSVIIFVDRGAGALGRRMQQEVESLGLRADTRLVDAVTPPPVDDVLHERTV